MWYRIMNHCIGAHTSDVLAYTMFLLYRMNTSGVMRGVTQLVVPKIDLNGLLKSRGLQQDTRKVSAGVNELVLSTDEKHIDLRED